jgi:hypothetical protein
MGSVAFTQWVQHIGQPISDRHLPAPSEKAANTLEESDNY